MAKEWWDRPSFELVLTKTRADGIHMDASLGSPIAS